MNLAMLVEPGASLERPFLDWWRGYAPPQIADVDSLRELAAAAFAAGEIHAEPDYDACEIEELYEKVSRLEEQLEDATEDIDSLHDRIKELEEEIEDLEAA